ncbi:hypothetical protein FB45DRAFT_906344 [Roridomyces roridus]|uniref:Uncharacterized protein n=1 Tax=Roridomyces roridus TaxID=1738132 RepID=A0AAD7C0Z6_9AGAR|nr:hypothetical protein FB45DRAFT_906344 [Roridomyces roridus]
MDPSLEQWSLNRGWPGWTIQLVQLPLSDRQSAPCRLPHQSVSAYMLGVVTGYLGATLNTSPETSVKRNGADFQGFPTQRTRMMSSISQSTTIPGKQEILFDTPANLRYLAARSLEFIVVPGSTVQLDSSQTTSYPGLGPCPSCPRPLPNSTVRRQSQKHAPNPLRTDPPLNLSRDDMPRTLLPLLFLLPYSQLQADSPRQRSSPGSPHTRRTPSQLRGVCTPG